MILIADGGATKAAWKGIDGNKQVFSFTTEGLSPVFMDSGRIGEILSLLSDAVGDKPVTTIDYYGAGVLSDEFSDKLNAAFAKVFPSAKLSFESDLLAAARALCGHKPGIACILGTGSNSCFYDGEQVRENVKAGGFILGDEAGGAYLGKRLLSDFLKGLLPANMEKELVKRFSLDYKTIVQKVYREPMPARYLASFAPFIEEFSNQPYMNALLKSSFEEFLKRNVAAYDFRRYPVNFAGSIAFVFRDQLSKCVGALGMRMGKVIKSPIDALADYYVQK